MVNLLAKSLDYVIFCNVIRQYETFLLWNISPQINIFQKLDSKSYSQKAILKFISEDMLLP